MLQIRSDKRRFPPYGLAGGAPGTPSANILNPGRNQVLLPTMGVSDIRRGDVLRHIEVDVDVEATALRRQNLRTQV